MNNDYGELIRVLRKLLEGRVARGLGPDNSSHTVTISLLGCQDMGGNEVAGASDEDEFSRGSYFV